jgi:hypothetical protein
LLVILSPTSQFHCHPPPDIDAFFVIRLLLVSARLQFCATAEKGKKWGIDCHIAAGSLPVPSTNINVIGVARMLYFSRVHLILYCGKIVYVFHEIYWLVTQWSCSRALLQTNERHML